MKILAVSKMRPGATQEKIAAASKAEAQAVWILYSDGVIREIYFSENPPGAVLILEVDSIEDGQEKLNKLPLVEHNLIEFELRIMRPFRQLEAMFA